MPQLPMPTAIIRDGTVLEGDSESLVPWWSIAKSVLAAAAMRLSEARALDLEARFEDWPFTIRQLLHNTSGLADSGGPVYHRAVADGDPVWSVEELLARRNARMLIFAPGTDWAYSNIGYLFVRRTVERAAGADLDTALRALVFEPLGLSGTRVASTPEDLAETVWGNPTGYDPRWVYHGLLIGPPTDAVRFLAGLLSGRLVSAASLEAMLSQYRLGGALPGRPWTETGYGLGLMIGAAGDAGRTIGHSGGGPGTVSAVYGFPDLPGRPVAAAFARGTDEGVTEHEVVRLALGG